MAKREGVVLAIESAARIEFLAIGVGSHVLCGRKQYRVISVAEVTRLNGRYATGHFLIKLRPALED
jgi:cobalamin biosynthesis protein CobT